VGNATLGYILHLLLLLMIARSVAGHPSPCSFRQTKIVHGKQITIVIAVFVVVVVEFDEKVEAVIVPLFDSDSNFRNNSVTKYW
jgi:hypothetical protein